MTAPTTTAAGPRDRATGTEAPRLDATLAALADRLAGVGRLGVAFSGGVD